MSRIVSQMRCGSRHAGQSVAALLIAAMVLLPALACAAESEIDHLVQMLQLNREVA